MHLGPYNPRSEPPKIEDDLLKIEDDFWMMEDNLDQVKVTGKPMKFFSYPEEEPERDLAPAHEFTEDAVKKVSKRRTGTRSPFQLLIGQAVQAGSHEWFRCIQPIGKGKSASAYLMLQTSGSQSGTFHALKVLQQPYHKNRWNEFAQELNILKNLDHPAVM